MTLDLEMIQRDVDKALTEDIGAGDVTSILLSKDTCVSAAILSREAMLVCGRPWVDRVFQTVDPLIEVNWLVQDGDWLSEGQVLCRLKGSARTLLTAERTALNFLQTLSGTATTTRHYVQAIEGTGAFLLDTRKTLPGLRVAQKYAVICGGGKNHRMGLYDAYLIKENHIAACGSITQAIALARKQRTDLFLEVEVQNLVEYQEALQAKPDRILLDNFTVEGLREAVRINQSYSCALEASGGVHLNTIRAIAETGVDYISVGDLTKSVQAIDLSLLVDS